MFEHEIARLKELRRVNRSVRIEEIEFLEEQRRELGSYLEQARLRLDAARLILRGAGRVAMSENRERPVQPGRTLCP